MDLSTKPVLIIGAGVSGLLLAQNLRKKGIPYRVFERDSDLVTRGVGWGLTLHWSLPALRELLPSDLVDRLPDTYVDRIAVEKGAVSTFPFYDLTTGQLVAAAPKAPESQRIRVARQKLREVLATGIDIEWRKRICDISITKDQVTATFDDGTSAVGQLLVGCDGVQSSVRRILFPHQETHEIPVRLLGVKLRLTPERMAIYQRLDPFFFHGTASGNDSFLYQSVLEAPTNDNPAYVCQLCVSWPFRDAFMGKSYLDIPKTNEERYRLIRDIAATWAKPFSDLGTLLSPHDEIKPIIPNDLPPSSGLALPASVALMGDSMHAMAMYRGDGANHAIVDVHDFSKLVLPALSNGNLTKALGKYEAEVIQRTRPAVFASRQACLDAHEWERINSQSPLLTKREMHLKYPADE